jgi:hypothetical protein
VHDLLLPDHLADKDGRSSDTKLSQRGLAEDLSLQFSKYCRSKRRITLTGASSHHVCESLDAIGLVGFSFDRETGSALAERHPCCRTQQKIFTKLRGQFLRIC